MCQLLSARVKKNIYTFGFILFCFFFSVYFIFLVFLLSFLSSCLLFFLLFPSVPFTAVDPYPPLLYVFLFLSSSLPYPSHTLRFLYHLVTLHVPSYFFLFHVFHFLCLFSKSASYLVFLLFYLTNISSQFPFFLFSNPLTIFLFSPSFLSLVFIPLFLLSLSPPRLLLSSNSSEKLSLSQDLANEKKDNFIHLSVIFFPLSLSSVLAFIDRSSDLPSSLLSRLPACFLLPSFASSF